MIRFLRSESGQDLAECCLITALVALLGLGIFLRVSGGVQNLWTTANTSLAAGNASINPSAASPATASKPAPPNGR